MTTPTTRVIALDGPSGSGKSTVARGVARTLGWRYVDTGATYRAATLAVLQSGADLADPTAIVSTVRTARIELSTEPDAPAVRLDGRDVSAAIRGPEVTAAVSAVSAVPDVRELMVALQRDAAGSDGAVVEGRDIATTVFPGAPVKAYLDASAEARARRRAGDGDAGVRPSGSTTGRSGSAAGETAGATTGDTTELERAVAADLARRDRLDSSRAASPLQVAADAVHLDTTQMDADTVVRRVLELAHEAGLT